METKSRKKTIVATFFISMAGIAVALWIILPFFSNKHSADANHSQKKTQSKIDTNFIKAIVSDEDTNVRVIRVSDAGDLEIPYSIDDEAGKQTVKRIFDGRRINISVIGVDSRLGSSYKHADANHVLSIIIDKGIIEITSIPRDTYADCGFEPNDTLDLNRLTNVYPARGREQYLKEVARIARLDKIHYYIELGFSQAMGILEFLGYKNSNDALQVLRSRQVLGGDDYQRSYNQGQFIRQQIFRQFGKVTGFFSDLILRGGLIMVNTNLTFERAKYIIGELEKNKLTTNSNNITVRVRPAIPINYKIYDFSDPVTMDAITHKLSAYSQKHRDPAKPDRTESRVINILQNAIEQAALDSAKNPTRVISKLRTYFDQRAWFQIRDLSLRIKIRSEISSLLANAYRKKKDFASEENIKRVIEAEKKLFSSNGFIDSVSEGSNSTTILKQGSSQ